MGCDFLKKLEEIIRERIESKPPGSYTYELYSEGPQRIAKKFGEEAVEVVISYLRGERKGVLSEGADLIYHFLLLLVSAGLSLDEVCEELERRHEGSHSELLSGECGERE